MMYTAEEKKQLQQLRWQFDSTFETQVKPVDGGYVISVVERFSGPDGTIVAHVSYAKVAKDGLEVSNYVFDLYAPKAEDAPLPVKDNPLKVVGEDDGEPDIVSPIVDHGLPD